jgi:hypothetical protein
MNIKKRAEERDNFSCVLTGIKIIEVAHIYPHHSMKQKEEDKSAPRHAFWDVLRAFWSKEKVTNWEAKLFPQGISEKGQEEVYNLISLAPTVHAIWGRGLFALKPISESDDKKTLTVQFLWQEKQEGHFPKIDLTTTPISTKGLEQTAGVWLFDKNGKKIQSGDYFELQTDDPIQKPLPSFELLELQWFLHRIQGMAGAADVEWPSLSDSGSDISDVELPDLELGEEDLSLLSSQPLSSPTSLVCNNNSNLPMHPKHQDAEGDGAGEGGRDLAMQRERGY